MGIIDRYMRAFLLFPLVLSLVVACQSYNDTEGLVSPSEKSANASKALLEELVMAPHGWKVTYFPRTDSLLFTNPKKHISENATEEEYIGYGGVFFTMRFNSNGEVEIYSEASQQAGEEGARVQKSLYEISNTSLPQLSFTTFNAHLHDLANDQFQGKSDFLFLRREWDGTLIFKTSRFMTPALEYIIFEKINYNQGGEGHEEPLSIADSLSVVARNNRQFFEKMKKPEITISQGDRIFFRSDYEIRDKDKVSMLNRHKYWLFRFPETPNSIPHEYPLHMIGLGSGYCGTDDGIAFYPGIRFNSEMIFNRFERKDNRFVCEFVRVYAPLYRKYVLAPRHLYPNGELTNMVAQIEDKAVSPAN